MKKTDFEFCNIWVGCILIFYIFMIFLYTFKPIEDPDFFWHLKTGEWIWQHKCLPQIDPFSIHPPAPDNIFSTFTLTSYWLAQLVLFGFYSISGWSGIILLRLVMVVAMSLLLASWCRLRNLNVMFLLILLAIQIFELYPLERPHVFSFICFTALLILLDRIICRHAKKPVVWSHVLLLCLLMLVWSNLHGGFLMGLATLLLIMTMEGIKFFHPTLKSMSRQHYKELVLIILAACAVSFVNPNPINSIKMLFGLSNVSSLLSGRTTAITEYYSSYAMLQASSYTIILNWFFILLSIFAAVFSKKRLNITWLAVLTATGYMGCMHIRYMPFFLITATLFLVRYVDIKGIRGTAFRTTISLATLAAVYFFPISESYKIKSIIKNGIGIDKQLPIEAADFIVENNLSGPVFNPFDWGGYLIWRLGPDRKIFIDQRQLDSGRYWEWLTSYSDSYRKALFDKYNIKIAILPVLYNTGELNPHVGSLHDDKDWILAFTQNNTCVYVRTKKQNQL